jgi:hypothetical protein
MKVVPSLEMFNNIVEYLKFGKKKPPPEFSTRVHLGTN